MSENLVFNFHNFVGVEIVSNDQRVLDFYRQEFKRARGELPEDIPKVRLNWEARKPFEGVPSGYTFHAHKLLSRWIYRISFDDERIEIFARGNGFAIPMVHHMLLHPALRYLSCFQNILMLHASAVVKDGQSLVLTGAGGAGKTTTSSLMLAYGGGGWMLHADDYVFVHSNLQTLGYLTRSHLYLEILKWIPGFKDRLTTGERIRLEVLGRIRSLTADGLKWPVRIPEERLWPNHTWAERASLIGLFWLRRSAGAELRLTKAEVDERFVDELLEMNFSEAGHFIHLVNKTIDRDIDINWVSDWRAKEKALIHDYLINAPVFWLEFPTKSDKDVIAEKLVDRIIHLLKSEALNNG